MCSGIGSRKVGFMLAVTLCARASVVFLRTTTLALSTTGDSEPQAESSVAADSPSSEEQEQEEESDPTGSDSDSDPGADATSSSAAAACKSHTHKGRAYEWHNGLLAGHPGKARGYHSATASEDGSKVYIFGGIAAHESIGVLEGEGAHGVWGCLSRSHILRWSCRHGTCLVVQQWGCIFALRQPYMCT